jgi:hypothetical protein
MTFLRGVLWLVLIVLVGCSGGTAAESATPQHADTARPRHHRDDHRHRTFAGTAPAMAPLTLSGVAAQHKEPVVGDALVHDGKLENVFVYLKEGLGDRVFAVLTEPVVIDQSGCLYRPRVAGAQTCQPITFRNSDGFLHNVPAPTGSSQWNFSMAVQGSMRTVRIAKPEIAVQVRCDVHPWMRAP